MAKTVEVKEQIEIIPISKIDYPVDNHRQSMDEAKLQELANSIMSMGVQQPIKVCRRNGRYAMIFGHRRVKASELVELTDIPAIVVEGWTDEQIAEAQVIENILREDLNPIEEAQCVQTLVEGSMFPLDVAASKMGKSIAWARQRLDLLRLDNTLLEFVASGRLPIGHAVLLSRVGSHEDQIQLARSAMGLCYHDALQNAAKTDHLEPLHRLRTEIKYMLCKMGSACWPKDVEYANRRPCVGCSDNTETNPGLFDSLQIERTSAKGNCTNPECFQAKAQAWEKDPVKIERDKAREAKKKANDKKSGEPKTGPVQVGESYNQREKRIKQLKKKFPWNAEQRFALALHEYGEELVLTIGNRIAGMDIAADPVRDLILLGFCEDSFGFDSISDDLNAVGVALGEESFCGDHLQSMWNRLARQGNQGKPTIDWQGEVQGVPLSEHAMEGLDSLEKIAEAIGVVDFPVRPTLEAIQRESIVSEIVKANKTDTLKAIAECEDGVALADMVKNSEALKLPKYKLKAIGERITELSTAESSTEKTAADHVCEVCREKSDIEQAVCSDCYELILHGPKRKQDEVIAAIEKAPLWLLEEIKNENPRGDWRRAALAKGIENLKKAGE